MSLADDLIKAIGNNDQHQEPQAWLDTGFPPLNKAISGSYFEGMPCGRIVEMFGPPSSGKTAISTQVMIAAQKAGGIAAFFDHERSFDVGLAQQMGLDATPGHWVFKTPETFEQSVGLAAKLAAVVREKKHIDPMAPIVVVFDSLASMVPKSKFEKDAADYNMNDNTALARATSAAFPALAAVCEKHNMLALFLNQARTKIGVMYGDCFEYHASVVLEDGSTEWIGRLVNNRKSVKVQCVNQTTGEVEAKQVVNWFRKPLGDKKWLNLRFEGGRNGFRGFTCTSDHQIFTPQGEKQAGGLRPGDDVITVDRRYFTEEQHEVVLGSILGDGQLRFEKQGPRAHLRLTHGFKQQDYLAWKCQALNAEPRFGEKHCWASTVRSLEFARYRGIEKFKALLTLPDDVIARITPRVAAIWYLDDGTYRACKKYGAGKCVITVKKLNAATMEKLADHFASSGMGRPHVRVGKGLDWNGKEAMRFMEAIAPYVPSCMSYKVSHWVTAGGTLPERMDTIWTTYTNKVVEVREVEPSTKERKYRYDIEVENNHNYVVSGVLVHNSTTTPGGNAPEYYASVRIKLGRAQITAGEGKEKQTVGQRIGAECVKNKVSRPWQKAWWDFRFKEDGTGYFDVSGSLVDHMIDIGLIQMAGARVEWKGGKPYKSAFKKQVDEENLVPELLEMLRQKEDGTLAA